MRSDIAPGGIFPDCIQEYTDPDNADPAHARHNGYWFRGRPSIEQMQPGRLELVHGVEKDEQQ